MRTILNSLILLAISASSCFAQSPAERNVAQLLAKAESLYDELEFEQSETALQQAVNLIEQHQLQDKTAANVYMNYAIVQHNLEKDPKAVVDAFHKALQIDPSLVLEANVRTPSLSKLFDEAQRLVAQRTDFEQTSDRDLIHYPPSRLMVGESLPISITVSRKLNSKVYRAYLYFKNDTMEMTQQLEMLPKGERDFETRIPNRYIVGQSLKYYIAVEDRQGNRLDQYGSGKNPVVVSIEAPVNNDIPMGSNLEDFVGEGSSSSGRKYMNFTLSLGTGVGRITDRSESIHQHKRLSTGLALAPFHSMLEVDFNVTSWFSLGAFLRMQFVEFDHLEGGRAQFKVVDHAPHSLILRAGGGIGHVRHMVSVKSKNGTGPSLLDYSRDGSFCYTLGVSYHWAFSDLFALVVTPDFYHLIGDSPSQHVDLNVGIQASFF